MGLSVQKSLNKRFSLIMMFLLSGWLILSSPQWLFSGSTNTFIQSVNVSYFLLFLSPFFRPSSVFLDFTGQSSKNPVFWGIKFAFFICALDTNLIHFPRKCKLWFIFSPSSAFNLSLSTGASHLLKCSISLIKTNKQKIMTPRKKNSKHP